MSEQAAAGPFRGRPAIHHVWRTSSFVVAVIVSLLAFPSMMPWIIGLWIVGHALLVARHRPGWVPLVAALGVVLIKRPYWPPSLVALVLLMFVTALARRFPPRGLRWILDRRRIAGTVLLGAVWIWLAREWYSDARCSRLLVFDPTRPVACIGDSLTSGVPPQGGFPDDLARRLTVPVVNLGQAGITAEQALRSLPELVRARPQVVVVELGGHDFLRGRSRAATRADLERIIMTLRAADAEVVLMEIPRGFLTDRYAGLERELARQYGLELISDAAIRRLVLFSPYAPPGMWIKDNHLSDDGLHPNARGNAHLADCVARALQRMYGGEVVRP